MCYRLAFFLSTYLSREHAILAAPIVGYVHDGTGDVMASHAWIEFNGKKTDIGLTITENPSVQLEGELLILDHVFKPGHRYTYHRQQSEAAIEAVNRVAASSLLMAAAMANKDAEHILMADIAMDPVRIASFLNGAPDGYDYNALARLISMGQEG